MRYLQNGLNPTKMNRVTELKAGALVVLATGMMIFNASPAVAQMDLAGEWRQKFDEDLPDRGAGPDVGDYTGMPVNDADRMRADTWTAQKWEALEHECEPHPSDYAPWGPGSLHVSSTMDPHTMTVGAWHVEFEWMQPVQTIWMDGRPDLPQWAPATWEGFSRGEWVADMLKVTVTHLKEGWIQRNGLARSSKAHLSEYFIRHADYLTEVIIVHDPIYLGAPLVRGANWVVDPGYQPFPSTCTPAVEVPHPKGWVPYFLPGLNPQLGEYPRKFGVPLEAAKGGPETILPWYEKRLQSLPTPPPLPKPATRRIPK